MRIALVSLQFEETATGGGGVHVENICEQFLKLGHNMTILSIHTEKTLKTIDFKEKDSPYSIQTKGRLTIIRFLIDKDIEHPYAGNKDTELDRIKRFSDAVIKWLRDREEEFDVVNLHGHHIITGYIAKELQSIKPKIVSTIHALESTYTAGKGEFVGAFDGTIEVLSKIRYWEAMGRYADYIVVNSPTVRDEFKEIILEFDDDISKYENKIILISSGCKEDFLMSDESLYSKLKDIPEVINIISFCRIDPSKGLEFSIKGVRGAAGRSKHKFCLTIAGIPSSCDYVAGLKKEVENSPSNLEVKFKLLDTISPTDEKKQILDDKHIYILSTLKEPFGMSVIEASARGNMVISADTNGPVFMFGNGSSQDLEWGIVTKYGILAKITKDYKNNFSKNIEKAIIWIINNWHGSIKRVLEFNKKIRNTWTWESISGQYVDLFKK